MGFLAPKDLSAVRLLLRRHMNSSLRKRYLLLAGFHNAWFLGHHAANM